MRRFMIGFAVLFTLLLVASIASAVPPGFCDGNEDHPQCATTTTDQTPTTTEPTLPACPTETWTISGKATTSFECLWKPTHDESPVASITVSKITGAIPGPPTVFVRDDSPGDICLLEQEWEGQTGPEYVAVFDLFYATIPVPTEENPLVLDYTAWLGHSYWDFVLEPGPDPEMEPGTHWCAPQDPILDSIRYDTNGSPLHVMVSFNAKKGGSLDITLSPRNSL